MTKKDRIRPDPDPQHCSTNIISVSFFLPIAVAGTDRQGENKEEGGRKGKRECGEGVEGKKAGEGKGEGVEKGDGIESE